MATALVTAAFGPGIAFAATDADTPSHAPSPGPGDTGVEPESARSGLVGIAVGRDLYLECRGVGSPMVVLVSGTQGASDEWTHVFETGVPTPSDAAVLPAVAGFTRVCAYDRPGTTRFDGEVAPSSPVAQPTTAGEAVADLRALLAAAGEPGPYVLVGASWGGLIAKLFASQHSTDVAGLVFVDGASELFQETLTQAQWDGWMEVIETSTTSSALERPAYEPSVEAVRGAPPAPDVPAVVLTSEHAWDLQVGDSGSTWPAWLAAQDHLAASLNAQHITDTDSGHAIALERPALVVDAIRGIVDGVRKRDASMQGDEPSASHGDFAGLVDIGGRAMYLECQGQGAPLVLLLSGLDTSADLWHRPEQPEPTVFDEVASFSRVCAYDRPGTPVGDGEPSRSDPVPMPVTTRDSADDLLALIDAADVEPPFVIAAHSYAGLYARVLAGEHPEDVAGIVFVDVLTPELQEEMTPEEWEIWKRVNARREEDIVSYPDLERLEFQPSVDVVRAAPPLQPMPVIVLSADVPFADVVRDGVRSGEFPPGTPEDFGAVIDRANAEAQRRLADLVPGTRHVTETDSGHNMMIDQPALVIEAIREVVASVRDGRTSTTSSLLAAAIPVEAQAPASLDAAVLEEACHANAPDEQALADCLRIVRTVLAPSGDPGPGAPSPAAEVGVGVTQSTSTLAVTLLEVEWEAALFPSEEADVVAVELAFESLDPEAYVDPSGLTAIDADGYSHTWGAIHRMGESPPGGYLDEGRRQRGWVGFEVPSGTARLELEYRGSSGERLVWTVERDEVAP